MTLRMLRILLIVVGISGGLGFGALSSLGQQTSSAPTAVLPKDVFVETGNRLPPIKREDLDETGKKLYDARAPGVVFGPEGIRLHSTPAAALFEEMNEYLRKRSGLETRFSELAILVTAREMDSQYVWTGHEPTALKAGVSPEAIDIVKNRKPIKGLDERDAVVIELGREALSGERKVSSDTAARALKLFGNNGTVNLVFVMGDYASIALFSSVFDQHVRPTDKPLLPIP